jgi:hypothetical protein
MAEDRAKKSAGTPEGDAAAEADPQSEVSPAELAEVTQVMNAFAKTGRSFKLYSRNNEMIVKFVGDLYDKLTAFLEKRESIVLTIRPTQFLYGGQAVYENDDREESFAFKLYKDGVRQMSFYQGMDKRELSDILDVVSTNFDRMEYYDDDIVTLLWKHNFEKISYVVVETFGEDSTEDEKDEYQTNVDAIVNLVKSDKVPENAIRSARLSMDDITVFQRQKEEEVLDAPPFTPSTAGNIFNVSEAEFQHITNEIQSIETQSNIDDMVEAIFETFEVEERLEDMNDLIEVILTLLDTYMMGGDLRRVNAMLKRLRFLEKPEYAPNFKFRGGIVTIFNKLADTNRVQQIFLHLNNQSIKGAQGDVFTFFSMQDPRMIPIALDLLGDIQVVQTRRLVVDSMILLAKGRPDLFAIRLQSDKWFIVTDMLYALGKMGGERALPYIMETFANPHPRVRQEVLAALRKFHSVEVKEIMVGALNDADPQVRTIALRHLANARDMTVLPILTEKMKAKEFQDSQLEEKKRYFTAMAMIGGAQLIPFFRDQLTVRGLLNKIHLDEMRAGAAAALGIVGNAEAIAILESGAQSTNKAIRESCIEVLKKLGRAQDAPASA